MPLPLLNVPVPVVAYVFAALVDSERPPSRS